MNTDHIVMTETPLGGVCTHCGGKLTFGATGMEIRHFIMLVTAFLRAHQYCKPPR
jgi:hypothetical protein